MSGRIIDADVDRLANIDRLTAQVERLKFERDMAVEGQRIAIASEQSQTREVGRLTAQVAELRADRDAAVRLHNAVLDKNARLQESLTACVQEKEALRFELKTMTAMWTGLRDTAFRRNERVKVLEGALRTVDIEIRYYETKYVLSTARKAIDAALTTAPPAESDTRSARSQPIDPDELSAAVLKAGGRVTYEDGAVVKAPLAETPALTCTCVDYFGEAHVKCPNCKGTGKPVARDASGDAPYDVVYRALTKATADLAAANEEIARLEMVAHERAEEVNTSYERGCREGAACATHNARERREALTAKLGRAEARIAELEAQLEQRK